MKKMILFCASILVSTLALAQDQAPVEMASELRSSGKIYVVVAVLVIIFLGIVAYMVSLDRKITKLERDLKNN